ncbi:MAG: hypothetical protein ACLRJV_12850 [Eubacteriales bacterium]
MMTGYGGTGKSGKAYHYYAAIISNGASAKEGYQQREIENRVVLNAASC